MAEPITTGAALTGIGKALGADILLKELARNAGVNLLQRVGLIQPSPLEQQGQQLMQLGPQYLSTLQRQAAGLPTAATKAQMGQLRAQTTAAQQSFAAGAQSRGAGQTTPARVQQTRFRAAEMGAQANLLGQAQQSALQQMGGLYGTGLQLQQRTEDTQAAFMSGLAKASAYRRDNPQDPMAQELWDVLKQILLKYKGGG